MSIPERLADAMLLLQHGRNEGALLSVLVSISATSRKRYPWPSTKSAANPSAPMGDREAFCTFLKDEFKRHNIVRTHELIDPPDSPMPPLPTETFEVPPAPEMGDDLDAYLEADEKWLADYEARYVAYRKRIDDQTRALREWGERQKLTPIEVVFYELCRCGLCHEAALDPRVSFVDNRESLSSKLENQQLELSTGYIFMLGGVVIAAKENAGMFSEEVKAPWRPAKNKQHA
ncbi:MAG: hypothetical protein ACYS0G_05125 [Planctomycetota bacterium]|jgi:hypothetical protein